MRFGSGPGYFGIAPGYFGFGPSGYFGFGPGGAALRPLDDRDLSVSDLPAWLPVPASIGSGFGRFRDERDLELDESCSWRAGGEGSSGGLIRSPGGLSDDIGSSKSASSGDDSGFQSSMSSHLGHQATFRHPGREAEYPRDEEAWSSLPDRQMR